MLLIHLTPFREIIVSNHFEGLSPAFKQPTISAGFNLLESGFDNATWSLNVRLVRNRLELSESA